MNLQEHIQRSRQHIEWIDSRVNGLAVSAELRFRLAAACLHQALEHSRAIVLLVESRLVGSAFSLVRLLFESYARGVWLHQCASEQDIARYTEDKLELPFAAMLQKIEQLEAFSAGNLSAIKQRSWLAMNSFTHTGFRQVVRRSTSTTVDSNYPEEEIVEALRFAPATAFMVAVELAHMARNDSLANELLAKVRSERSGAP